MTGLGTEAQRLLNAPGIATKKGLRDRAIVGVLLGCGLRRSEVAAFTLRHTQKPRGRAESRGATVGLLRQCLSWWLRVVIAVTDGQGALVPGAAVTVKSGDIGVKRGSTRFRR